MKVSLSRGRHMSTNNISQNTYTADITSSDETVTVACLINARDEEARAILELWSHRARDRSLRKWKDDCSCFYLSQSPLGVLILPRSSSRNFYMEASLNLH